MPHAYGQYQHMSIHTCEVTENRDVVGSICLQADLTLVLCSKVVLDTVCCCPAGTASYMQWPSASSILQLDGGVEAI
jgi:hypothetical protein